MEWNCVDPFLDCMEGLCHLITLMLLVTIFWYILSLGFGLLYNIRKYDKPTRGTEIVGVTINMPLKLSTGNIMIIPAGKSKSGPAPFPIVPTVRIDLRGFNASRFVETTC